MDGEINVPSVEDVVVSMVADVDNISVGSNGGTAVAGAGVDSGLPAMPSAKICLSDDTGWMAKSTYLLSKMLLGPLEPMSTMMAPMEALVVQLQGKVLWFRGYRPSPLLQRYVQMIMDAERNQHTFYFIDIGPGVGPSPNPLS